MKFFMKALIASMLILIVGCTDLSLKLPTSSSNPTATKTVTPLSTVTKTATLPPTSTNTPVLLTATKTPSILPKASAILTEIPSSDPDGFLHKYGWSIKEKIEEYNVSLPKTFTHVPGTYPIGLYWAYNNELSRNINLDFIPYLGKEINYRVYKLKEPLPQFMDPDTEARAIILSYKEIIIGAWVEAAPPCLSCAISLSSKKFDQIVSISWDEWLAKSGVIDINNSIDRKMANYSQKELIDAFFKTISDQNLPLAYTFFSRGFLVKYVFGKQSSRSSIPLGSDKSFDGMYGFELMKSVQVKSIQLVNQQESLYEVHLAIGYFKEDQNHANGDRQLFLKILPEGENFGYRITDITAGP